MAEALNGTPSIHRLGHRPLDWISRILTGRIVRPGAEVSGRGCRLICRPALVIMALNRAVLSSGIVIMAASLFLVIAGAVGGILGLDVSLAGAFTTGTLVFAAGALTVTSTVAYDIIR